MLLRVGEQEPGQRYLDDGVLVLNEPLTTGILIGFPLVLLGAFLATWRPRRARVAEAAALAG